MVNQGTHQIKATKGTIMNAKEKVMTSVYEALIALRENHPKGLQSIGSGNAHEVLTRFGIPGQIAEHFQLCMEILEEEDNGFSIASLMDIAGDEINAAGKLKHPFNYDCEGVAPGERDENNLATHPDLLFTAVNHNGKRFAVEADASQSQGGGLTYYQDWRNADELKSSGVRVLTLWDGQEGRFWDPHEIAAQFSHAILN